MKVIALHRKHEHANTWLGAFKSGLKRHGLKAAWTNRFEQCDLAVLWGVSQRDLIARYAESGTPYLILECGFVGDRLDFASAGYGGLNGRADFRNARSPGDRWKALGQPMAPWRPKGSGDYVLIMGQVQGDQSIRGIDIRNWYAETAKYLTGRGLAVAFRPHPKGSGQDCPKGAELLLGDLSGALSRASCVVTYNSNAGVDAVLAGVPVIAVDAGSMALSVAGLSLYGVTDPPRPGRTQWAHNLAYAQWRESEFRSGLVWEHLNRRN